MKIPAYWSKATATETDRKGKECSFTCWRSSEISESDARESALAAAKRALQRFLAGGEPPGRYSYGETPLREEVVQRLNDGEGKPFAAVTRNSYGVLVLNTARAMFIDLDFPLATVGESLKHVFVRLFNNSALSPEERRAQETLERLKSFVSARRGWSVRVYRTCAGLRCLVTHDLFDPASDETMDHLRSVGADPLYVRLCKAQECFRARLTPKPWRCRADRISVKWPRDADEQKQFEAWLAGYDSRAAGYSTCHFLGASGGDAVHPEVAKLIELHDAFTKCGDKLSLA
ncbi:MAG: hypothetical protein GX594_09250 [Pirellulaceae bacterium]|nr:hypothetical protein [Pirellulaceae bacterium]